MQKFVPSIKGLRPAIDRRKVNDTYVVDGRNFIMTVDGPVSGLGRTITGYKAVFNPTNVQTFDVVETHESYMCTNEGIFRFNTTSEKLDLLFELSVPVLVEFPWTQASVGNKVYFTRPGAGLIEFDVTNASWQLVSGGSIPTNIYACEESEGRLILLTDAVSAWSAIGDGQDFTPSTVTGAGSQVLTKMGVSSPTPLGMKKTADGYLTFLSSGIMKSQAIQSANPFRHVALSSEHVLINPYSLTRIGASHIVFATLAGLFETSGAIPKPYQPLMSEYFHEKVFPLLDIVNNQNSVQLYSNFARSWFVISISINQQDYAYDVAYLLNLRTGEWGSLNDGHTAFINFETLQANQSGFNFSLLTFDGTISRFSSALGIENVPELDYGLYYNNEPVDPAARDNTDVVFFTCRMYFRTVATDAMDVSGLFNEFSEIAEYLSPLTRSDIDDAEEIADVFYFRSRSTFQAGFVDVNVLQEPTPFDPLDAHIELGVFRLFEELTSDRLAYMTLVAIHMLEDAVGSTYEDWMSQVEYPVTLEEDWLTMPDEFEDWGGDPTLITEYASVVYSSLDAHTPDTTQDSSLTEYRREGKARFYSCYSTGLYHTIAISALELSENFDLKALDMTINQGGRI